MEIKIDNNGGINIFSFYNTHKPGLIFLLVDQTNYKESILAISKEVNIFILNLILCNVGSSGIIKNRCYIKLISYKAEKFEIKEGWLSFFADNPSRIVKVKKKFTNDKGNLVEIEEEELSWIEDEQKGSYPANISFVENHFKEWHVNKEPEYPESIIVHFYKDEKNEIAQLVKLFVKSELNFKGPKLIEKVLK
ncbi:MAG: hypothetical protein ACOYLP_10525 [Flavobacterium sp.]|uniref:hypothetical protein n=1 Tax=Flavobacterium sp. TaxID=239 RepID=UPI003BE989CE